MVVTRLTPTRRFSANSWPLRETSPRRWAGPSPPVSYCGSIRIKPCSRCLARPTAAMGPSRSRCRICVTAPSSVRATALPLARTPALTSPPSPPRNFPLRLHRRHSRSRPLVPAPAAGAAMIPTRARLQTLTASAAWPTSSASAQFFESLATAGGHFTAPTFELAAFGVDAGGWSSDNTYPRKLADVDGGGRADIVGFSSAGVYESLATAGGHFAMPTFELAAFGVDAGGWSRDKTQPRAPPAL